MYRQARTGDTVLVNSREIKELKDRDDIPLLLEGKKKFEASLIGHSMKRRCRLIV
jgi:hypothetical protein